MKPIENKASEEQVAEPAYCSETISHSGGVTVSGQANFQYRELKIESGQPTDGLTGDPKSRGIPYAEIRVTNSNGATVQCAETNETGAFSFVVPNKEGTYKVSIFSRSNNSHLKASILKNYFDNDPHFISKSFKLSSGQPSVNLGTLEAKARLSESEELEGGAFNIHYNLYLANKYLKTQLGDSNFVADKVRVYWRAGFNPYSYFGGQSLLSFYRPGRSELFILGGTAGRVHNVDTDHFDNSIILHEYGHFLEDRYSVSDSPGGSHSGNSIIDPRLAFSEGWGNFFQAAVLGTKYYADTKGFSGDSVEGGNGALLIHFDLSEPPPQNPITDFRLDNPTQPGEGIYREVAISRFLNKTITDVGIGFKSLWETLTGNESNGTVIGFRSKQEAFRNMGRFNQLLEKRVIANHPSDYSSLLTAWESILDDEKQSKTPKYYANTLEKITKDACGWITLDPAIEAQEGFSNLYRSNHFYRFDHDGANKTIQITYENGSDASNNMRDLDLILFKEDYVYQEYSEPSNGSIVKASARAFTMDQGTESISLNGVPAGKYLINVRAYTYQISSAALSPINYRLQQIKNNTTEDLCPKTYP